MQFGQRAQRNARRPHLHPGTGGGIQHPGLHDDDDAGRHLDVNNITIGATFNMSASDAPAVECVPTITHKDFIPDMGRMTARLCCRAMRG
jgi:hypothetical protein